MTQQEAMFKDAPKFREFLIDLLSMATLLTNSHFNISLNTTEDVK